MLSHVDGLKRQIDQVEKNTKQAQQQLKNEINEEITWIE